MVDDTGQLHHEDADPFGSFRHLGTQQLLNGQHVAVVVAHRAEIIEAVCVGNVLNEGVAFADFLVVAVQVAHHRV